MLTSFHARCIWVYKADNSVTSSAQKNLKEKTTHAIHSIIMSLATHCDIVLYMPKRMSAKMGGKVSLGNIPDSLSSYTILYEFQSQTRGQ